LQDLEEIEQILIEYLLLYALSIEAMKILSKSSEYIKVKLSSYVFHIFSFHKKIFHSQITNGGAAITQFLLNSLLLTS
jgi:hypothetical protein